MATFNDFGIPGVGNGVLRLHPLWQKLHNTITPNKPIDHFFLFNESGSTICRFKQPVNENTPITCQGVEPYGLHLIQVTDTFYDSCPGLVELTTTGVHKLLKHYSCKAKEYHTREDLAIVWGVQAMNDLAQQCVLEGGSSDC